VPGAAGALAGGSGDVDCGLQRHRRKAGPNAGAAARHAAHHLRAAAGQDARRVPAGAGAIVRLLCGGPGRGRTLRRTGRGAGAAHAAAARRAVPDGADGVADGAVARGVRVGARERRAERAAARGAGGVADHGASHRPDRRRLRGHPAVHPAHYRRPGARERGTAAPGRVALRSGDHPYAMEVTLNEFDRLTHVAVKHARDAFVSAGMLARQWASHGFTAAPDFAAACREHDAFLEILASHGAELTFLPADSGTTIDSIYTRDASLVTPRGVVLCAMGKPARHGEPAAQGRVFAAAAQRWTVITGTIEPPGRIEGGDVVWL